MLLLMCSNTVINTRYYKANTQIRLADVITVTKTMSSENNDNTIERGAEALDPDRALEIFEARSAEAYFSEIDSLVVGVIDRVKKGNVLSPEQKRNVVSQILEVIERYSMDIRETTSNGDRVVTGIPYCATNGKETSVLVSRLDTVKSRFEDFLNDPEGFLESRNTIGIRTGVRRGRENFLNALAGYSPDS